MRKLESRLENRKLTTLRVMKEKHLPQQRLIN